MESDLCPVTLKSTRPNVPFRRVEKSFTDDRTTKTLNEQKVNRKLKREVERTENYPNSKTYLSDKVRRSGRKRRRQRRRSSELLDVWCRLYRKNCSRWKVRQRPLYRRKVPDGHRRIFVRQLHGGLFFLVTRRIFGPSLFRQLEKSSRWNGNPASYLHITSKF